jgi:hypothetical protein
MKKLLFQCVCSSTWQEVFLDDDGFKAKKCGFCGIPLTSPQPTSFFPALGDVVYRGPESRQPSFWNKATVTSHVGNGEGSIEMLNGFWAADAVGAFIRLSLCREGKDWLRVPLTSQEDDRVERAPERYLYGQRLAETREELDNLRKCCDEKVKTFLSFVAEVLPGRRVRPGQDVYDFVLDLLRETCQQATSLKQDLEIFDKRITEFERAEQVPTANR